MLNKQKDLNHNSKMMLVSNYDDGSDTNIEKYIHNFNKLLILYFCKNHYDKEYQSNKGNQYIYIYSI